jgi:hypothetical protein
MGDSPQTAPLRPLSIGEIFDRAITLYVRNIVTLSIVVAMVTVPMTLAQYFADRSQAGAWTQILHQIQHPQAAPPAFEQYTVSFWALIAAGIFLTPFSLAAVAVVVGGLYAGETPDWRKAWAAALAHGVNIVLTTIVEIVMLCTALLVGAIPLFIIAFTAIVLAQTLAPLAAIIVVLLAIIALAYFVFILLCYLSVGLALNAIVIEDCAVGSAIRSGFARIFQRREIGRSTLVCLALLAAETGLMLVVGFVQVGLATLGHPLLQAAAQGIISLPASGFVAVLVAVYYFDVRIRNEGLDVANAIDRLETAQASGV